MSIGIDGVAAPLTVGPPGINHSVSVIAKCCGLPTADEETDVTAVVIKELTFFVHLTDFFELNKYLVAGPVVAKPDRTEYERCVDRWREF
jgi:hypothetical protein